MGWGPSTISECGTSISSSSCCDKRNSGSEQQNQTLPPKSNPLPNNQEPKVFQRLKSIQDLQNQNRNLDDLKAILVGDENPKSSDAKTHARMGRDRDSTSTGGGVITVMGYRSRIARSRCWRTEKLSGEREGEREERTLQREWNWLGERPRFE